MAPTVALLTILDTVTANLRATAGYCAPQAVSSGVIVYDGPMAGTNDAPSSYVCIGWRSDGDTAGTLSTDWAVFSPRADRLEDGTFDVTVVVTTGDTDATSTARAALGVIVSDLRAAVYGLADSTFDAFTATVSSFDLHQIQSASGLTVEASLTFTYRVQEAA